MPYKRGCISRRASWILGVLLAAAPALALQPDEIALVINSNVPASRQLAEFYAQQRHIPPGRIIGIDLDPDSTVSPAEQMDYLDYEPKVAAPIRDFLTRNNLESKVKCLVTFWGMPLRIARKPTAPGDKEEAGKITRQLNDLRAAIGKDVAKLEKSAVELSPAFKPQGGDDVQQLGRRMDAALTVIGRSIPTIKDPAERSARIAELNEAANRLAGADRATVLMSQPAISFFSPHPPLPQDVATAQARLTDVDRQINQLDSDASTSADREKARKLAGDNLGLFGLSFLLNAQRQLLETDQTESALDSELSLLWWHGYPRTRWLQNTLQWRIHEAYLRQHAAPPPSLMVTRLDGPSEMIVRNIILDSIQTEATGLHGQVVIDARGKTDPKDAYTYYDQTLRNLADLVSKKTKLKVTLENTEALIPAHTQRDMALYCGWYSLRNYYPLGTFNKGAVGFHVASFELISLRAPHEHGWVRGLLYDGVAATLGPVAEPYLQSFPPADEFFPLLMTGKLTLAEVYWRTVPWVSWMQTCIGDPLYIPYKADPPLQVQDLPGPLRAALEPDIPPAASQPAQ